MTPEDAELKAQEAFELGFIQYDQIDAYIHRLLEKRNSINKSVDHEAATSIHSKQQNLKE